MRLVRAAWMGLVAALAVTAASGQTGGLKLRVYDAKDNSPLPGAVVVLSHATGNVAPATELTDADGYVVFPVLRAGTGYIIEVAFPGYAKVRRVSLTLEPWTVENGLQTATLKLKRTRVFEHYHKEIAHLYEGH